MKKLVCLMGMLNAGGEAWELGDQENGGKTHKPHIAKIQQIPQFYCSRLESLVE